MSDVFMIAAFCLGLCVWNLYLQHVVSRQRIALAGAMMMVEDLAEGNAVIEKIEGGFRVRRVKDDEASG